MGIYGKPCPRCRENELEREDVRNALSRRDNQTYICSPCGEAEASEDIKKMVNSTRKE